MNNNSNKITNLVFKGGGAKGCAYAGCIQVLEELNLYNNVTQVAGTSAGAITAALLAAGAGSDGLTQSVKHTEFRNFVADSWGVLGDVDRLVKGYGLHTGNGFVTVLKQYLKTFSGDENLTFDGLMQLVKKQPEKFKMLTVVASNITTGKSQLFSAENTPNVEIWQAVRASMSIPLLFEPANINNNYYVDGGLAWNYPIEIYDADLQQIIKDGTTPKRNMSTLGFYLEPENIISTSNKFAESSEKINSLSSFASSLVDFMYQSANMRYIHPEDKARTVFIDDLGVSATDFSIPDNVVNNLINSGNKATKSYFSKLLDQ